MNWNFPGLQKVSLHAFGQETVPASKLDEVFGMEKNIRLTAMNHPDVEGDVETLLKEDGRWTPEVTKFNTVVANIEVTEPGPHREVIVAQLVNAATGPSAQVVWVDEEGNGHGYYELRVREYAARITFDKSPVTSEGQARLFALNDPATIQLSVSGGYTVALIIDGMYTAIGQLNRQSYRDSLFYFGVGPAVAEIGEGVASLNVNYLDVWHSIDTSIPNVVVQVKGRKSRK